MRDSRFETSLDSPAELAALLDLDGIDDLESMLVFLFRRPVGLDDLYTGDPEHFLDVLFFANDEQRDFIFEFPGSVLELVRVCAETVKGMGPHVSSAGSVAPAPDYSVVSDDELISACQRALGEVRLFNLLQEDEGGQASSEEAG